MFEERQAGVGGLKLRLRCKNFLHPCSRLDELQGGPLLANLCLGGLSGRTRLVDALLAYDTIGRGLKSCRPGIFLIGKDSVRVD
jgi:hypothetical protein